MLDVLVLDPLNSGIYLIIQLLEVLHVVPKDSLRNNHTIFPFEFPI